MNTTYQFSSVKRAIRRSRRVARLTDQLNKGFATTQVPQAA